ncbi:MAG: hypothetical protein IJK81_04740 [Selenomonadaceae bacterium]|nr:hypothetical protein [Selenomonadaceae bacterium]
MESDPDKATVTGGTFSKIQNGTIKADSQGSVIGVFDSAIFSMINVTVNSNIAVTTF